MHYFGACTDFCAGIQEDVRLLGGVLQRQNRARRRFEPPHRATQRQGQVSPGVSTLAAARSLREFRRIDGAHGGLASTPKPGVLRNSAYSGIRRTPEFGVRPDFVSQGRIQGIDGTPICTPLFVEGGKPLPLATVMPQPAGATRQAVVWPAGGRSDRGSCSFTQQTGATPVGT